MLVVAALGCFFPFVTDRRIGQKHPSMGPSTTTRARGAKPVGVTAEEVRDLIGEALTSFKAEVNTAVEKSTGDLLQRQMAEFRLEMKQEFRSYMEEAKKQNPPAGNPDASTKTGFSRGSRGIFPTIESINKENGRFRALLDQ